MFSSKKYVEDTICVNGFIAGLLKRNTHDIIFIFPVFPSEGVDIGLFHHSQRFYKNVVLFVGLKSLGIFIEF